MRCAMMAAGWMTMFVLMSGGCAQNNSSPKPSFVQPVERFEGVARNTQAGPRLQLDNGNNVICIVETESGENAWPSNMNDTRIRVEGYRIRSDSAEPNAIVLRCVNWNKAGSESSVRENQVGR